ncbi:unnamed protein product (macronuclear) [Paramecium tetraurelia]|uniref:PX domain-containing protein n=1 Tax=Paramecium tetraurelia TaxID=5888 RepID=A0BUF3_PARTE|nr:uncharacterized protein GSPATT00032402001 [Paramecium tetraurelia]CAK62170.1 unnamed protein product [Paramecium tetraurelia]|eukprot:XP_001429568.1 hypothetical protein (macronuclear) [Paramecium tetraurelia strain d4-2]
MDCIQKIFVIRRLPILPKKNFITFLVGKSIEQINERKYGLQRYLQTLASRQDILDNDSFQQFLKLKQPEQLIKEELFKENIIEQVQSPLKIKNQFEEIQDNQPKPQQVFVGKRDYQQQTSFIENQIEQAKNNSFEQPDNQQSSDIKQNQSNDDAELIAQMKTQLQEFYDQITEKDAIISNFNQKELETQEYYNQQIYEKQYRINELNGQVSQYQESYAELQKQYQDMQNYVEELKIKLQESQQYAQSLEQQFNEQQNLISQQMASIGYENLNQTQLSQIIIEQQKKIDQQIQTDRERELEFKHELEKHYIVEAQRDELFQENQLLKDQLEEELQQRNEQTEAIEQLKLEMEYLQMQLKEKQELLDIKNELS